MAADRQQELLEKRAELYQEIKKLADRQSEWTAEDREHWEARNAEFDAAEVELEQIKESKEYTARVAHLDEVISRDASRTREEVSQRRYERQVERGEVKPTEEHRALSLQALLLRGNGLDTHITPRHEEALGICRAADVSLRKGFWARIQPYSYRDGAGCWDSRGGRLPANVEMRAGLNVGTATEGPELIPEGFVNSLEHTLLAFGGLRRICRILSTASGNDLVHPTINDTGNTGALLAEATDMGASVDPVTGSVTFKAWKYSSKPILISAELLQDSAFNMAQEIGAMLGERIGRISATHFASTDAGTTQPQGVRNGSTAGVTAASATVITADELVQLQDSLDPAYEGGPAVGWIMNKATRTEVRLLKSESNQYIWQPGLTSGEPDQILGKPLAVIQEMPNTVSAAIPVIYGDFSKYVIRDAGPARLFVLEELYRATDQTGFVSFHRMDGRTLNTGALKRLTMAV